MRLKDATETQISRHGNKKRLLNHRKRPDDVSSKPVPAAPPVQGELSSVYAEAGDTPTQVDTQRFPPAHRATRLQLCMLPLSFLATQ